MVAPAGAGPWPQMTSTLSLPLRTSCRITGTSPPGPLRCGSTTCSVNAVATAASKALPPRSRIPMPTAVAIQWVEVTTPKVPSITGRVVKGLGLMLPAMGFLRVFWRRHLITAWRPDQPALRASSMPPKGNRQSMDTGTSAAMGGDLSGSFRLCAGELHHLGPFLGFFGNVLPELGGRAGNECGAHAVEPSFHRGIGEDRVDGRIELADDLGGRVLRRADAIPRTRLVAGHEIGDGRSIRQQVRARRAGDRQHAQPARTDVLDRRRYVVEHHLHLPANHVGQCGRTAAIGHVHHIDAGHHLEQLAGYVNGRSRAV